MVAQFLLSDNFQIPAWDSFSLMAKKKRNIQSTVFRGMTFVCKLNFGDQRRQGLTAFFTHLLKLTLGGCWKVLNWTVCCPHPPGEMLSGGLLNWWGLTALPGVCIWWITWMADSWVGPCDPSGLCVWAYRACSPYVPLKYGAQSSQDLQKGGVRCLLGTSLPSCGACVLWIMMG